MPDIFLSYSREDQGTAQRFAEGFEHAGFSVWWDATLEAGEAYDEVTEKALLEAKAVVVLWSKKSVASRWVRAEATLADRKKTLVPVMIEPCTRPIMFELTHTADLSHWTGDPNDKAWLSYVAGLRRFVDKGEPAQVAPPAASGSPHPTSPPLGRPGRASRGRRISAVSLGIVALLLIAGGIQWAFRRGGETHGGQSAQAVVSLAVLPFVNLSSDPEQEYFSDGLSEELLNQLAQIKELRVAGRTSSFSFKGKNEDLRVIGEKLGVNHLLEGSVRKDGKQLRITAQLINAVDGTHLWSQTYDREPSGIFAVQDEIAKDVSKALSITLDVGEMSRAKGGTTNIEAYDKFLRAQEFAHQGGDNGFDQAARLYREAVTLDPAFVRAWWGLRYTLLQTVNWIPESRLARKKEMAEAETRIVALVPKAWWTQAIHSDQYAVQHKWLEAEAADRAAMSSAPASENYCSQFLLVVGRIREAVPCFARARQTDPLSLYVSGNLQFALDLAGRPAEAQAEYERSDALAGEERSEWAHIALFRLMARKDADPAAVKAQFLKYASLDPDPMALVQTLIDSLSDKAAARAAIGKAYEDPANGGQLRTLFLLNYADRFGDRDLALAALRRLMSDPDVTELPYLWFPSVTALRTDPRFKALLRDLGLADYFRKSGNWGDFCKPVGKDDFECN